jgi:hypothetical protein
LFFTGILEQSLYTEPEAPNLKMEDVGSSYIFTEGKTMPNTARKKKKLLGNALLFTSQKELAYCNYIMLL